MTLIDRDPRSARAAFERKIIAVLAVLVTIAAFLTARLAFAQDVAVPPGEDLGHLASTLIGAIQSGNWGIVVAAALVLLVSLVRRFGSKVPFLQKPLSHPVVLWALPTVGSVAGAILTALASGTPLTVGLVLTAIMQGLAAVGLYVGAKKVGEARDAGNAAAGADADKAAALEVLK